MIIYDKHATDFFNLGLGPLTNVLKSTVHEERNGAFYLELTSLHDERLQENNIIKTDAGHLLKDQRFMIKKITDNHDGTCEVYAVHCSYLAQELTLKPQTYIAGATATQALIAWENAIYEPHPFAIYSDVETVATTSWSIAEVNNPRRALGGARGSVLDVWGGEYQFDNYLVRLLKKRGTTAQTVLAYGRNITGFEMETNIDEVYTSIYPYAIQRGADGQGDTLIAIEGLVVDVDNIAEYPNRRTLPVDFSDKFDHDDAPTQAKLVEYAQKYITDNKAGVPKISMRVKFADLSKSADYADYKQLEQVNLCDEVRVIYPKLGVNTVAKVTKITWNCLTKSYDEIEIGEKRLSLGSKLNEQEKQIEEITTQVNHAQLSADGKNMIFYDLYGEDGLGEPTATKVGDSWFKPNGEQIDLYIWDGTIWREVLSNAIFNELSQKVEQAEQDILDAMDTAQSGVDKANQAILDAGFAEDLANDAKSIAVQASADVVNVKATADQAKADASTSLTNAQNALNKAIKSSVIHYALSANGTTPPATGWQTSNPNPTADQYVWTRTTITLNDNSTIVSYSVGKIGSKGDKGDTGGQGIQGVPGVNAPTITSVVQQFYLSTSTTTQTGGSWLSTVPVWSSGRYYWVRVATTYSNGATTTSTPVLDNALNDSLVTALEVKTANQNLSTTVSQHATLIEGKANSTTVDAIAGRVTTAEGSISAIAGQVALKANTTDVNTITGRVATAEGNITTQAGQIALKANQSVVDTLTGRVSTTEAKITATDGKVTTLTTKTDGNTTSIGQLQTSYSGLSSTVTQVKNNLEGMEIGGRNYLKKSDLSSGAEILADGSILDFSRTSKGILALFSGLQLEKGKYIYHMMMKKPVGDSVASIRFHRNSVTVSYYGINQEVDGEWNRIEIPFEVTDESDVYGSQIYNHAFGTDFATTVEVMHPMIEKGNKATDWTPAPEDYTTVTAFSALEQNLNGFKTTVQNTYADKTTVTQLAGQWSSTVAKVDGHTGQISNLGEQINLRLTKEQVADEILKDNQVLDTRNTNQPPSWYYTNHPKQSVRELKLNSSIGLSGAGMYSTVTTDVGWSDSSGGNIEQTAKADNGVYQRRGDGASWSAWARVADTSNILSQINLSTEGVLIQGKNIWLDGNTKINDAVIKTAHISDLAITSAKIADLAVTSAKIVSLDASKINVGTLTGFTINAATINGGEIRGNTLIYLNDGTNNTVLSSANGVSTTREIASRQQIRSEDWIYAGTNIDGTWKAGFGFQGERVRTNYIDPIYTNGILNVGQLSTIAAKVQVHLDSVFKRSVAVETALRLADNQSAPATTGMMSIWCGYAYAGYGIYATAPNGTSKPIAIWT